MSPRLIWVAALLACACSHPALERTALNSVATAQPIRVSDDHEHGRLAARPQTSVTGTYQTGLHKLGLGGRRDGLVYVPKSYDPDRPAPLAVLLHGAGGEASHAMRIAEPLAEQLGLIVVAIDSRGPTWDVILDSFGQDVAFIDHALSIVFERYAVDPARVAVGGFSDGASYALSLGLTNGDLFHEILAFSPGFTAPGHLEGHPRVFISHGTNDTVLPIRSCSRRIVPALQQAGYDVTYREFNGPHTVPVEMAREALTSFVKAKTS